MTRESSENLLQKPFVGKVKTEFRGYRPSSRRYPVQVNFLSRPNAANLRFRGITSTDFACRELLLNAARLLVTYVGQHFRNHLSDMPTLPGHCAATMGGIAPCGETNEPPGTHRASQATQGVPPRSAASMRGSARIFVAACRRSSSSSYHCGSTRAPAWTSSVTTS